MLGDNMETEVIFRIGILTGIGLSVVALIAVGFWLVIKYFTGK